MLRPRQPLKTSPAPSRTKDQRRRDSRAEDFRLIEEALRGDDRAYKKLMAKYHDAIHNFISRMVHDREQVEDLTQEAFIKAFSSLRNFNEEFAFSTWLYKIATNNCIDYIRKKKLQMYSIDKPIESKDSDFTFELPDESYEADQELISDQRTVMLRQPLNGLPEHDRALEGH
jgi:RNA polymerase sigma-70 factor (ECF subfamily)